MGEIFTKKKLGAEQEATTFSERVLVPVLLPEKFLSAVVRSTWIDEIKRRSGAPQDSFQEFYQSLINNFTEFVQALPVSNRSRLCSILDEGLQRALYAIEFQHQERPRAEALLNYVVFSAALLFDVAKVIEERTVMLSHRSGAWISNWSPHDGSMLGKAEYYRIRRGGGIPPWLARKITPILAYEIMPEKGFSWIAGNPQMLNIWISLLLDDPSGAGSHSFVINRAQEKLAADLKVKDFFAAEMLEVIEPDETKAGEEFLDWLKEGLEDGSIQVNAEDAHAHMTKEGFFLEINALIKEFSEQNPGFSEWQVNDQFKHMGIAETTSDGEYVAAKFVTDRVSKTNGSSLQAAARSLFGHQAEVQQRGAVQQAGAVKETAEKASVTASRHAKTGMVHHSSLKQGVAIVAWTLLTSRSFAVDTSGKMVTDRQDYPIEQEAAKVAASASHT